MKKKTVALLLALVLVLGVAVGGTIAWLLDTTAPIVNTFTAGNVDIELAETTTTYKMVPGTTIAKDPKVAVKADSEKCYVFVKLDKSANFDSFMTYTVAAGWTELESVSGVYYRVAEDTDADQEFAVLANDQVTVKDEVTKAQLDAVKTENKPTLTITAYACQYAKNSGNFTAPEAWMQVKDLATGN